MVVASEVIRYRQDFESARKKEAVNLMTRYGVGCRAKERESRDRSEEVSVSQQ